MRALALAVWLALPGFCAAGAATAEPPAPADSVLAAEGDSLVSLAARPEVYGDGRLYPLLIKANRDRLPDPRILKPGLRLRVPRDSSPAEREKALEESMTGEWLLPPLTPEKNAPEAARSAARAWVALLLALGLLAAGAWLRPRPGPLPPAQG